MVWLFLGVTVNPSFQSIFRPRLTLKPIVALPQSFDIPDYAFPNVTYRVIVRCNVSGTNFAVGEPVGIYLRVSIESIFSRYYDITNLEGDPVNSVDYWLNDWSNGVPVGPYPIRGFIPLDNSTGDQSYHNWEGANTVVFLASGPLRISIKVATSPTIENQITAGPQVWNNSYTTTLQFPEIEIAPQEIIQQQISDDVTLSLTYIVLFFASVNIGVVLYDHSEDKDEEKQAEYQERKAKKKRRYETEDRNKENTYVV